MKKETKNDIFKMIYQFLMAGTLFWVLIYLSHTPKLTGSVISSLGSVSTSLGLHLWFFITLIFIAIGFVGLFIQRKIHLKFKREKVERRYRK